MVAKLDVGKLYVGYFDRGADPAGLNYWLSQNMTLTEIANSFAVQPEATATYAFLAAPNLQSIPAIDAFINSVYLNNFERTADAAGLAYYRGQLLNGRPPGQVVVDIQSGAVGDDLIILNRKAEVAVYYAEKFALSGDNPWSSTSDLEGAHAVLVGSRAFWLGPNAVATAKATADAEVAKSFEESFDLTPGTDDFVGSSADDDFNAPAVQTGGVQLETLNTTDSLDGGGGRNTLNAQLIAPFVVPKLLANIQEVNIDGPPGIFLPFIKPVIDVVNADAIDTFRFRNPTQDITVNNLSTALELIEILDDSFGGNDFTINHIGDAVGGTQTLQINLANDGAGDTALNLNHASGTGYNTIRIDSGGPVDNFLELNASPRNIIITGNGTPDRGDQGGASLTLRGDALNLGTLDTLNSTALPADFGLDAFFHDGVDDHTTKIDTGNGDDNLVFDYGTRGVVIVNSNGGADFIDFWNHTGTVTVNGGAGDDHIELDVDGNATANGDDGDDYLEFDVTGAVNTNGGNGDDVFNFLAQDNGAGKGLVSFGANDFANGGPGDDLMRIGAYSSAGSIQLLTHGAGITNIETIEHYGTFLGAGDDLLVNMAQMGSAKTLVLAGDGDGPGYGDDVILTALQNDQTVVVQDDIFDDLDLTHDPQALEIFNIVMDGGVTVGELRTAGFDPDTVNINSIGGGLNLFEEVDNVFGDLFITGDTDLQLGTDNASGYFFSIFPPGGLVDASNFLGDLTMWAQWTVQTFWAGSGNDWFNGGGGDDQFDLSTGGSDTVVFQEYSDDGTTSLADGLEFQNIYAGYDVTNDFIHLSVDGLGLQDTNADPATLGAVEQLNVAQNGAYVTGDPAVTFLLFTTQVSGATDAQNGFDLAIGGGEVETPGDTENVLGAFYDATNGQAVLFTVDGTDNDNGKIQAGDDVEVVALVSMTYTEFLGIGGSLELI